MNSRRLLTLVVFETTALDHYATPPFFNLCCHTIPRLFKAESEVVCHGKAFIALAAYPLLGWTNSLGLSIGLDIRPHRLTVRTAPFHGANRGSIPRGVTNHRTNLNCFRFFWICEDGAMLLEYEQPRVRGWKISF